MSSDDIASAESQALDVPNDAKEGDNSSEKNDAVNASADLDVTLSTALESARDASTDQNLTHLGDESATGASTSMLLENDLQNDSFESDIRSQTDASDVIDSANTDTLSEEFITILTKGKELLDQKKFEEAANFYLDAASRLKLDQSTELQKSISRSEVLANLEILSSLGFCYRRLNNFEGALQWHGACLQMAAEHQQLSRGALACGDIGEAYAISGELSSNEASRLLQRCIPSQPTSVKNGVGGSHIPELASLIDQLKETDTLEVEKMPDALFEGLSQMDASLMARRLSGINSFTCKHHILETIQWIEHMSDLARKGSETIILIRALGSLGALYQEMHQYSIATRYFEHVVELAESLGEKNAVASGCMGLGLSYDGWAKASKKSSQKNSINCVKLQTKAIEWYERAHAAFIAVKDQSSVRKSLQNIAKVHSAQKNHHKAIESLRKALADVVRFRDKLGEAVIRGDIGLEYQNLAQHRSAVEQLEICLEIAEELGDRPLIGRASRWIGVSCVALGKHRTAVKFLNSSFQIACETLDSLAEFDACMELGACFSKVDQHTRAAEYFERALEIADNGSSSMERFEKALEKSGNAHYKGGNFAKALELYERHLAVAKQLGNEELKAHILVNISNSTYWIQRRWGSSPRFCTGSEVYSRLAIPPDPQGASHSGSLLAGPHKPISPR